MRIEQHAHIILRKSTFCTIVIGNGLLVSILCFLFVQPVYKERVEQVNTQETRMELVYLNALFGIGPLVSRFFGTFSGTVTAA